MGNCETDSCWQEDPWIYRPINEDLRSKRTQNFRCFLAWKMSSNQGGLLIFYSYWMLYYAAANSTACKDSEIFWDRGVAARNENDSILSCRSYRVSVNKDQTTEISLSIILNSNRLRCQNLRSIYSTWISQRVCCLFRFFSHLIIPNQQSKKETTSPEITAHGTWTWGLVKGISYSRVA